MALALLSATACSTSSQRDAVLQQRVGIDQHLKLLAAAAHRDHLRDAGNREQPLPHDPIGQRADLDRVGLAAFAPHADQHDLAHDRRDRRQLRPHSLRQAVGGERHLLGHDLPIDVDVGAPVELDVDHRQPDARRAADRLHAGGAVEHRLERKRDLAFRLPPAPGPALRSDRDPRPIEIGKHVDRQVVQHVAAVHQHHQRDGDRQRAIPQARIG